MYTIHKNFSDRTLVNYYFSWKLYENEKKWARERGVQLVPPKPAYAIPSAYLPGVSPVFMFSVWYFQSCDGMADETCKNLVGEDSFGR